MRRNRLTAASDDHGWAQAYSYDAWGNMATTSASKTSTPVSLGSFGNDRIQSPDFVYDYAGNVTQLDSITLTYNANNQKISTPDPRVAGTVTYSYDGPGQRVKKTVAGGPTTVYVYDAFGQVAAEYSSVSAPPPCSPCYPSYDYLGSVRVVTDAGGNVVARHDYLPFGEANTAGLTSEFGGSDGLHQRFTGQDRDSENAPPLDYFNARYYAGVLGRFLSPDPRGAGVALYNPQTWHGYSYVFNNPLTLVDPSGMCAYGDPSCFTGQSQPACKLLNVFCWLGGNGSSPAAPSQYAASDPGANPGGVPNGPSISPGSSGGQQAAALPAKTGTKACANGIGSGGVGIGGGYNLDLAAVFAGLSSTGGVGGGLFHNRSGGATSGYSAGGFASGGAAAYAGSHVAGAPKQSSSTVFAFGAYAGAGANIFFTNAASVKQLAGPFTTISANGGLAEANFGLQVSFGGGIWQVAITPPMASVGFGFAASAITTNTLTTNTGCN